MMRGVDGLFGDRDVAVVRGLAAAFLPDGGSIPGGATVDVAARLEKRAAEWAPRVAAQVRWLIRAFDVTPVVSRHGKRFSSLAVPDQVSWVSACHRSRVPATRTLTAALKQLVLLTWASTSEVEAALGFDYRCRLDDVARGHASHDVSPSRPTSAGRTPRAYHRPGPATRSGAVPGHRLQVSTFEARPEHDHRLTTSSWPDLVDGMRLSCDVVVIGSGAGGAVAAATLARAGAEVIVVEEGPPVDEDAMSGPVLDRFQRFCRDNATTQVWGSPPIPLPLGRVVGGTTVVNSGTCFRPPDRVLHRWANEHGIEVTPEEMAPYFDDVESFLNVRPVPWKVLGPNGEAAHRGATALGLSGGPLLRNIADCHGCGQCAFGCPTGAKQAMHVSYLPRAQMAGARILARCRVDRIVHDGAVANSVEATLLGPDDRPRGSIEIEAQAIVVAAGAVHTPALLQTSGVPDRSGQTGRNLRIHPATGVGGFFPGGDVAMWKGTLQSYYIDALFDSHEVMFEATSTIPSVGAGSMPGLGRELMDDLGHMRDMATLGFYVSDTSRGRVRATSMGPVATYRLNECDTKRVVAAISLACEVLLAAGATRVNPGVPGIPSVSSSAGLTELRSRAIPASRLRLTAFHPMGTARMGRDPSSSVVDGRGRHHQLGNLWVADASVFPTCVGVNPQVTIMGFAQRTAEAIAAR